MASLADLVRKNFVWRLEALTPTETTLARQARFFELDMLRLDPTQSPALMRGFSVAWLECGENLLNALGIFQAMHLYRVEVYYSHKLKWADLWDVVLRDRFDIVKLLRDDTKTVGYSATQTTTDVGIGGRWLERAEIVDSDNLWTLQMIWRVCITETEI